MPDPLDEHIFGRPAGTPPPEGSTEASPPTRRRRRLPLIAGILTLLLVVALVLVVVKVRPLVEGWVTPNDYAGEGTDPVTVVVKQGDTGTTIAKSLADAGVVRTPEAFTNALAATKGDEIQPGSYTLKKEMKASAALSMLRGGARDVWKVTIREGLWKSEVYKALSEVTGKPVSEYEAVEKQAAANPSLLGLPASSKGNPEGWLFPATYTFDKTKNVTDQLKDMVAKTQEQLSAAGVQPAQAERVLTIASMVEAEARRDEDRPKVARVLENRLAANPPMPLQLDSTAAYGVQERPGKVFTTDQMRQAKNEYNTYVIPGLPVGPTGNMGEAAIKAAVHPAQGSWLYFVTIDPDTGETAFTDTLSEHEAQIAKLQNWCAEHSGKC